MKRVRSGQSSKQRTKYVFFYVGIVYIVFAVEDSLSPLSLSLSLSLEKNTPNRCRINWPRGAISRLVVPSSRLLLFCVEISRIVKIRFKTKSSFRPSGAMLLLSDNIITRRIAAVNITYRIRVFRQSSTSLSEYNNFEFAKMIYTFETIRRYNVSI